MFDDEFVRVITVRHQAAQYDAKQTMPARLMRIAIGMMDWLVALFTANQSPRHLQIGARGEEEAYFQLRRMGYVIVARNFVRRVVMERST